VSLFDRTVKNNPKAVVTAYAWQASSCDPCPTTPLTEADFQTLGADAVPSKGAVKDQYNPAESYVLTRLHARYDKTSLGEDLVFKAAGPIVGGREFLSDGKNLEQGSRKDSWNNFQARYAIRYPWAGEVKCSSPVYGRWGGPPSGQAQETSPTGALRVDEAPCGVKEMSVSAVLVPVARTMEGVSRALPS
jgi:hypothetical protein